MDVPAVRYAVAGRLRLAYQVFGEGPRTVVAIPPLAQNIELAWERPEIAGMLRRFGSFCRYVHFDKRGTGASDRSADLADLDERVEDMLAIFEAADVETAHLYGVSDGGPMAILFAVTHPERVSSLILDSTAACFVPAVGDDQRARRMLWDAFADAWGTDASMTLDIMAPTLAASDEYRRWQPRYERQSATPSALRDLLSMTAAVDVTDVLGEIDVPTLQLHRKGDQVVPVDLARTTASAIAGCRFVEFVGRDHFSFAHEIDAWMDEIEAFVNGRIDRAMTAAPTPAAPPESTEPAVGATTIRTLGRFVVLRDGVEVPMSEWGSRRARQLCKRLVIAGGDPVPRAHLIELLWPESNAHARLGPRLSVLLSAVRRVLSDGVTTDRASVSLDTGRHDVDLVRFRRAVASGDDQTVVALYRGEFLPDDIYEDWASATRDECRHAFVSAALRVTETEPDAAKQLALLDRILSVDPYHDIAHRRRIGALAARGDHGEVGIAYERYRTAMAEIGLDADGLEAVLHGAQS